MRGVEIVLTLNIIPEEEFGELVLEVPVFKPFINLLALSIELNSALPPQIVAAQSSCSIFSRADRTVSSLLLLSQSVISFNFTLSVISPGPLNFVSIAFAIAIRSLHLDEEEKLLRSSASTARTMSVNILPACILSVGV